MGKRMLWGLRSHTIRDITIYFKAENKKQIVKNEYEASKGVESMK